MSPIWRTEEVGNPMAQTAIFSAVNRGAQLRDDVRSTWYGFTRVVFCCTWKGILVALVYEAKFLAWVLMYVVFVTHGSSRPMCRYTCRPWAGASHPTSAPRQEDYPEATRYCECDRANRIEHGLLQCYRMLLPVCNVQGSSCTLHD